MIAVPSGRPNALGTTVSLDRFTTIIGVEYGPVDWSTPGSVAARQLEVDNAHTAAAKATTGAMCSVRIRDSILKSPCYVIKTVFSYRYTLQKLQPPSKSSRTH